MGVVLLMIACCDGRVEIVNWDGQVLRSFGLDECEGSPHDARIVRRNSLLAALRTAVSDKAIHYGVSIADVHATDEGGTYTAFLPILRILPFYSLHLL